MEASRDFIECIECLNRANVEFLLVGAHALAYHGAPRFTGDLDVWIRVSPENLARVYEALRAFGMPLVVDDPTGWLSKGDVFQMGVEPVRIDILTEVTAIDFETAWTSRVEADFHGHRVGLLSRSDLLRNKRAVGRPRDLADIGVLEAGEWIDGAKSR